MTYIKIETTNFGSIKYYLLNKNNAFGRLNSVYIQKPAISITKIINLTLKISLKLLKRR